MTVTVVDRGKGRDYQFRLVTVTVADTCPVCGGPRGVPELRSYCEDGEWYQVHNWSNPCGHPDRYPDVIAEAAQTQAVNMTADREWELCGIPVVERAKREVLADIARGVVPPTVRTFAELHDHVDANEYGGACEGDVDPSDDEQLAFWNRIQAEVDQWLRAGRPS